MVDQSQQIANKYLSGFIIITGLLLISQPGIAQRPASQTVSKIIENIMQEKDQALDYTDLVTSLNEYYDSPLSLNNASREELLSLYILSVPQVNDIIAYRDQYDGFTTLYELQTIESLPDQTIKQLLPFVNAKKEEDRFPITLENLTKYGSHDLILRSERTLEQVKGQRIADTASKPENNKGYLGSPYDLYTRYIYNFSDRISLGFTAEKDAGEAFFKEPNPNGFDFYSGHLFLQDIGPMKSVALGDFEAEFGQGLILSSGLTLGKTPNAIGISRNAERLDAYTSANENNYFRGVGATYEWQDMKLTGFYSNKLMDANLTRRDTLANNQAATSIKGSGMHRTWREYDDKKVFRQQVGGANVTQEFGNLSLGATGIVIRNEKPLTNQDRLYKKFGWEGKEAWNASVDYQWLFRDFYFFGEVGYSHTGALATLNGLMLNLPSAMKLGALYRNYPKNFTAPYGNAFRESGQVSNENGLFLTLQMEPFENWSLSTYIDYFKFPWLRYQTDQPSDGYEYLGNIVYNPGDFEMEWRIKGQSKVRNLSDNEASISKSGRYHQWRFRWDIDYELSRHWSAQTRLAHSFYQIGGKVPQNGWLAFQDLRYETMDNDLYIIGRYCLFNVDDYQARIFTYENDLLYTFSIPFFQDRGMRYYLLSRLKTWGSASWWVKFGRTRYFNKNQIGSSYQEIQGNRKTTLKTQVRFKF